MKVPDDDLRQLLHEWRDTPAIAPGLAASVEKEVARRDTPASWRMPLGQFFRRDEHWAGFAVACVAVGIALGLAGAEWRAARMRGRTAQEMPARYVQWIDPAAFATAEVPKK